LDPNAGLDDSFDALAVATDFDLDDPLDDGGHDHMGYAVEVIEPAEPSGVLAVAKSALVGFAKVFVSIAALAVTVAFSTPDETSFDCFSTAVLHPAYKDGTPDDEGDAAERGVTDDIESECGDHDDEHSGASDDIGDGDNGTAAAMVNVLCGAVKKLFLQLFFYLGAMVLFFNVVMGSFGFLSYIFSLALAVLIAVLHSFYMGTRGRLGSESWFDYVVPKDWLEYVKPTKDAVVASALNVSTRDRATWVNNSGATRHMVQDRRLCFNVRKA